MSTFQRGSRPSSTNTSTHTRRALLGSVGAAAVDAVGLPVILRGERLRWTTIPTVLGADGVRARRSVPVVWLNREREAARLESTLGARDGVVSITRTNSPETVDDWRTPKVFTEIDPATTAPRSTRNGIGEIVATDPDQDLSIVDFGVTGHSMRTDVPAWETMGGVETE